MLRLAALISLLVLTAPEALAQTRTLPSCANYAYGGFNSDACRAERAQMRADGARLHRETMEANRRAAERRASGLTEAQERRHQEDIANRLAILEQEREHARRMREDPAYRAEQERLAASAAEKERRDAWLNQMTTDRPGETVANALIFPNGARWVRTGGVRGHIARRNFTDFWHQRRLAGEGAYVRADGSFAGCGFFSAAWDGFEVPTSAWKHFFESGISFFPGRDLPSELSQDRLPWVNAVHGAVEIHPKELYYYRVRIGPGGAQWHGLAQLPDGTGTLRYSNLDDERLGEHRGTLYAPTGESLGPAEPDDPRLFALRPAASASDCTRPLPVRVFGESVWVDLPDALGAPSGRGVLVQERDVIAGVLSASNRMDGPAIRYLNDGAYAAVTDAYRAGVVPWRIQRRTYSEGAITGLEVDDTSAGYHAERFYQDGRLVGPSELIYPTGVTWEGACDGTECTGTRQWPDGLVEMGRFSLGMRPYLVRQERPGQPTECRLFFRDNVVVPLASPAPATCQGCVSGDCERGTGTLVRGDGEVYIGGFRDGRPHGDGVSYHTDNTWYDGEWRQGLRHGSGRFVCSTRGTAWRGRWRAGEPGRGSWWSTPGNESIRTSRNGFDRARCAI